MTRRAGKSNQGRLPKATGSSPEPAMAAWLDAIATPVLLLNDQAKILFSNQACLATTGYSTAELCQKYLWELLPPAEQTAAQQALRALASQPTSTSLEMTWVYKTGKKGAWELTLNPLPNPQDADPAWVATGKPSTSAPLDLPAHPTPTTAEDLAALVESSTDLFALADMDGRLTFINQNGRDLVGLTSQEAVHQTTIADYFFADGVQRLTQEVLPTIAQVGFWQGELAMRHFQTGEAISVLFNSTLVRHPQTGEPIGLGTVGRNIKDIKQMELEGQKYEAALHSLMVGTAAATGKDFFPTFVEQVAQALGVSHALVTELSGNRLHTLAFWSNNQLQPNHSYAYLNTPCELSLQQGVYACPTAVQQAFPADHDLAQLNAESYLGVAIQNLAGETIGNLCLVDTKPLADIERMETILRIFAARAAAELERQRAIQSLEQVNQTVEKALRENQALLQLVLDALPLSIFWKDRNCVYLGCNQQMLTDAGLTTLADMIGKTDFDLPWKHGAKLYRADDLEIMETGQAKLNIEAPMTKSGNLYRWLRTTKIPLRNADGEIIGVLGFCQDVTNHKQLETQLCQSNEKLALANLELTRATRLKDDFLANMSHELRTPLSSILGMTQALSREIYGPMTERQHRSLSIVERSGRHLLSLINEILEVAKIEAGRIDLQWEELSVRQLCEDSLVFVQQHALQKHIHLKLDIAPTVTTVQADGLRLKQVLINLLDNALKFTPEEGQVNLEAHLGPWSPASASQVEERLIISVTDTGIGIAPEDQPRLFQTFVQLDSSLNRQYFGTGLGLALVKHIVELHGGTVDVESGINQGSKFILSLPQKCRPDLDAKTTAEASARLA